MLIDAIGALDKCDPNIFHTYNYSLYFTNECIYRENEVSLPWDGYNATLKNAGRSLITYLSLLSVYREIYINIDFIQSFWKKAI